MSDLYSYITLHRPTEAQDLCLAYGYPCDSYDETVNSLVMMVHQGGVDSLKEITDLHPDKDLILEFYADSTGKFKRVPCENCAIDKMMVKTNQADGGTSTMAPIKDYLPGALQQTNTLLIMGIISAFVIALVVYKN